MSQECNHDCSNCQVDCDSRQDNGIVTAPLHKKASVRHVIGVVSGKGGVGKSMTASLLATLLRRNGSNVAILDADMTGPSIPSAFGLHKKMVGTEDGAIAPALTDNGIQVISTNLLLPDETDPVIWRGPVIAGMVTNYYSQVVWNDVDYMIIDMPPGTGDVPLTVFQSIPIEGIIVVTSPQELVSMIVGKAVKMAGMLDIPLLGVIENMSYFKCPDCGSVHEIFGKSKLDQISTLYQVPAKARIPFCPDLAQACDNGSIETWALENFKTIDPAAAGKENDISRVINMIKVIDDHFNG